MSTTKSAPENQKAKSFGRTSKRLLSYFKPYRKKVILLMVCAVISVLFAITGPRMLGTATNLIVLRSEFNETGMLNLDNMGDSSAIEKLRQYVNEDGYYTGPPVPANEVPYLHLTLGILVIVYSMAAIFSYIQQKLTAQVAQRTIYDLREAVSRKIQRLPLNYYDTHTHGEILSRTTTDIEQISTTIQQMLTQMITSFLTHCGHHGDDVYHQRANGVDCRLCSSDGAGFVRAYCAQVPEVFPWAARGPWDGQQLCGGILCRA